MIISTTQVTNNVIEQSTIPRNKLAFGSSINSGGAFRNKIINGAMEIDQRNEGAAVTFGGSSGFGVDRCFCYADSGGQFTAQRVTDAPVGFRYSNKFTITQSKTLASTDLFVFNYRLEKIFVDDLLYGTSQAKTTVLSFWVKGSVAGTYSGRLGVIVNDTTNQSYVFNYILTNTNTWEYKSIIIPGNTTTAIGTNTKDGLRLVFSLGSGTTYTTSAVNSWIAGAFNKSDSSINLINTQNATLQFTGMQFEAGTEPTGFESLPSSMELQRCQRYFCKSYAPGTVPGTATTTGMIAAVSEATVQNPSAGVYISNTPTNVTFPVPMRDVPALNSLVLYNPYATNATYTAATLGGGTQVNINYSAATVSVNMRPQRDENGIGEIQPTGASVLANAVYVFHYTAESEI